MKTDEELPIIRLWYEFTIWLLPKIQKFPRDLRFVLGERIEQTVLKVLEKLIEAKFTRDRIEILDQLNVELEKLRFLLRISHDLKALPTKAYGMASNSLMEIGSQVGGWKKASQSKGKP